MNYKKVLAGVLSAAVISIATPYAANAADIVPISAPISVNDQAIEQSKIGSFTGTVKEVNDYRGIAGSKMVLVENKKGSEANFIIFDDTYVLNNEDITVGSIITGYFDASKPMIMIYPPQYSAELIVVENKDSNNLQAEPQPDVETPEYDVSTMGIVVNNKMIKAPTPYETEQGTVMVPVRAIADALGYEVKWDSESQSIMVGKGISFKVGADNYNYMKMTPIKLGVAPELVDGTTYVPLNFFRDVMRLNNAYIFESVIVINDGEKIQ